MSGGSGVTHAHLEVVREVNGKKAKILMLWKTSVYHF